MKNFNTVFLGLVAALLLAACTRTAVTTSSPAPSASQQVSSLPTDSLGAKPNASFFSGLPIHLVGETAAIDGYQVQLGAVDLKEGVVTLSLVIDNQGSLPIDLNWAVQLYLPDGTQIKTETPLPENESVLQPDSSITRDWSFTLPNPEVPPQVLIDYRFLFAPRGWSGPIILYRLTDVAPTKPVLPTPPQNPPTPVPSTYGVTGDPWKMLVLIYRNMDTDYVEDGVTKHLTATMPDADITNMRNSFLNLPHRNLVYGYSDNLAEVEANVVIVERPLTNMEPISTGYWPSPSVTKPELDQYGPKGKYDSVVVFWQASNPNTGQSLPIYGWGLGYWPGDYANGMTYATVFNLSWYWPGDPCRGEVFLHEWLHGVTGYYMSLGFPFPYEDLHGAEEAGYTTNANGCWEPWLRDYMRGLVYENGAYKALVPATWQGGSITTHTINGWRGEYFNNETLSGIPVMVRDDAAINFDWAADSPHPLVNADHFSIRWTRQINFTGGTYDFSFLRDDGARLWIDDVLVRDAWQYGRQWEAASVPLSAGTHTVRFEMFEIDGWSAAILNWQLQPLPEPLNLSAVLNEDESMTISWQNQASGSEVLIERSLAGVAVWTQISKTAVDATSFQDTTVLCGKSYVYRARALKNNQYSAYSGTASADTSECITGICKPARTLLLGGVHTGNTARTGTPDEIDHYRRMPWDETGPEYAYTFYANSNGEVEFLFDRQLVDLDVIVLDDTGTGCDPNNVMAYGDNSATIFAQAGHTYHVVVDGEYGQAGVYTLRARALEVMPADGELALSLRPTLAIPELGARSYTLQVSRYSDFHRYIVNKALSRPAWMPSSNLLPATTYYWRIKVRMPDGTVYYMGPYSFTTSNPPGKSLLISPKNGAKNVSRWSYLEWSVPLIQPDSYFDYYEVQIATDSKFNNPVRITIVDNPVSQPFVYVDNPLTPLTRYYWRVRAHGSAGEFGAWSATRYFRTGY